VKVILLEGIGELGKLGETVEVKPGYGRNYLLPQGKAILATPEKIKYFEERREELENAEQERINLAKKRAAELAKLHLTITARVSEEGKLYGSIGATEIVKAINAAGLEAKKQEVQLPNGTFRSLGENFEVNLHLHHGDIVATVKLNIVAEA
jgi:large subunit ribosomal protein L9